MSRFSAPRENWTEKEQRATVRDLATRIVSDRFTWTPPSVPANSTVDTSIAAATYPSVTGLRSGAAVTVTPPSALDAGITVTAWAGDDSITIRLCNLTASPVAPAAGVWAFLAVLA